MIRVLLAAPLRQDVRIFREHQESIDRLKLPAGVVLDRFYVVNDCPEVIPEIRGDYVVANTGDFYGKTADEHLWTAENLIKMHGLRNRTIRVALSGGYDYLFSVDTDLVLHPDTLVTLMATGKDIVSELFYTNGWANAWREGQYTPPEPEWKTPGLYRVGMTGACMLVRRNVLEAGVDYSPVSNLGMWGEDRHFCIRAAVHGFGLWTDTHCPPEHLYTEAAYQAYMARKEATA